MGRTRPQRLQLATLALPLMPAGGRIVFVTGHQAHFHDRGAALPCGHTTYVGGHDYLTSGV